MIVYHRRAECNLLSDPVNTLRAPKYRVNYDPVSRERAPSNKLIP